MTKYLESGIKELVEDFQLNGKPCPSRQPWLSMQNGVGELPCGFITFISY
ncbi:hypothetical protein BCU30_007965 [Vibrio lentus]|nr:hypothetical protein [Vibrio lentus]